MSEQKIEKQETGIATFGRTKKLSREYPKHLTL